MNSESNTNNTNSDKKMYNVNEYIIDFNRKVIQLIIEKKQNINYHWISAS